MNDGLARLRHRKDVVGCWDGHRFREARVLQRLYEELVGLVNELPADRLRWEREVPGASVIVLFVQGWTLCLHWWLEWPALREHLIDGYRV